MHPFNGYTPSAHYAGDITALIELCEQEGSRLDKNVIYFAGTEEQVKASVDTMKTWLVNNRATAGIYVGENQGPEMVTMATIAAIEKFGASFDNIMIGSSHTDVLQAMPERGLGHCFTPSEDFLESCGAWKAAHPEDGEPEIKTGREVYEYLRKDYTENRVPNRPFILCFTGNQGMDEICDWMRSLGMALVDNNDCNAITPDCFIGASKKDISDQIGEYLDRCREEQTRQLPALAGMVGEEYAKGAYRSGIIVHFIGEFDADTDWK